MKPIYFLLFSAVLACSSTDGENPIAPVASTDNQEAVGSPAQFVSFALTTDGDEGNPSSQETHVFVGLDASQVKQVLTTETNAGISHIFWHVVGSQADFRAIPVGTPVPLSETNLTFRINMRLPRYEDKPVRFKYMDFGQEQTDFKVIVEEASFGDQGVLKMSWFGKLHFDVPDVPGVDMYFTHSNRADAAVVPDEEIGGEP